MALLDPGRRHIELKVVYTGPSLGGKTTNLRSLQRMLPVGQRSELTSIAGEDERTLFFDYLPLDHPEVAGYSLKLRLYTVAGQERYAASRDAVLNGADGIVFVVDSQRNCLEENKRSLTGLARYLASLGKTMTEMPLVLQYNKMDLAASLDPIALDRLLNPLHLPRIAATAVSGEGVIETLSAITRQTVQRL